MKGMRKAFQNKSGRIRQKPNGRIIRLAAGNGVNNDVWRIR